MKIFFMMDSMAYFFLSIDMIWHIGCRVFITAIGKEKWNISDKAQRKHLIKLLEDHIVELRTIEDELKKADMKNPKPKAAPEKKTRKKNVEQEELALNH